MYHASLAVVSGFLTVMSRCLSLAESGDKYSAFRELEQTTDSKPLGKFGFLFFSLCQAGEKTVPCTC
jgi:hypothetical protein